MKRRMLSDLAGQIVYIFPAAGLFTTQSACSMFYIIDFGMMKA